MKKKTMMKKKSIFQNEDPVLEVEEGKEIIEEIEEEEEIIEEIEKKEETKLEQEEIGLCNLQNCKTRGKRRES